MKKITTLLIPVITATFLVGCGTPPPAKETVSFSLTSESQTTAIDNSVKLYVDWTPSNHSIKFDSFTLTTEQSIEYTVSFSKESEARPMEVNITFADILKDDLSGSLNFSYLDKTTNTSGNDKVTVSINSPLKVSEDEFNQAASLMGFQYMQIEETRNNEKSLFEFSPTVYHMRSEQTEIEKYLHKVSDNVYDKYYHFLEDPWTYTPDYPDGAEEFLTPQTHDEAQPKSFLDSVGGKYGENINYDASKGSYICRITYEEIYMELETKFMNKKVISFSYFVSNEPTDKTSFTYQYEEITPELPII